MSDDLRLCPRCERAWIADRLDACTRCSPPLSTRGSPGLTAPVPGDGEDTTSVVVGTGEACDLVFADAAYGFSGGSA
jgi:hypothetical protein